MKLTRLWLSPILHISLLLALTWACWNKGLAVYFLADDLVDINYIYGIFHGHPQNFWNCWLGVYMNRLSIKVYRPWMMMTEIFDYLIWGPNPFGFHLSNLLYYSGDVVLLYFLIRQIPGSYRTKWISLAAFFSAALFAVTPLHCESICWIVGRLDVACCFYYLLALNLLIHAARRTSRVALLFGLLSFVLALGTKEMAVGLPVVLTTVLWLFPNERTAVPANHTVELGNQFHSLKQAFRNSWSVWVLLVCYFIIRSLALGEFVGGYTGIGHNLPIAISMARWFRPDSWYRIIIPFHAALSHKLIYTWLMSTCILALSTIVILFGLARTLSFRWLAMLSIWSLSSLVPIYRLWYVSEFFYNSRFVFFFTMPLYSLIPVLIFSSNDLGGPLGRVKRGASVLCVVLLCVLTFALAHIAHASSLFWLRAGQEVERIHQDAICIAQKCAEQKIILLNLPTHYFGAFEFGRKVLFRDMLSPPFSPDLQGRFLLFQQEYFIGGMPLPDNPANLKRALVDSKCAGPYVWDRPAQKFEPVILHVPVTQNNTSLLSNGVIKAGNACTILELPKLQLNPLSTDYLEFEYCAHTSREIRTLVFWNTAHLPLPLDFSSDEVYDRERCTDVMFLPNTGVKHGTAVIKLSAYPQWFAANEVKSLSIAFRSSDIKVWNIRCCPAPLIEPQLNLNGNVSNDIRLNRHSFGIFGRSLYLKVKRAAIASYSSLHIEISKPNSIFASNYAYPDNFYRKVIKLSVAHTIELNEHQDGCYLDRSTFLIPGSYQIRAISVAKDGSLLGQWSYPTTIWNR